MPALDPFSASSRPMYAFDNKPSHPLPFAATLQPIDPNTQPINLGYASHSSLPKPKRYKDTIPTNYPAPPYLHSRHTSFDFRQVEDAINQNAPESAEVGSDEWMQRRVAGCVDSSNGVLDLKSLGLRTLSTKIVDLRDLVTLPSSFSPHTSTSSAWRPQPSPGAPGSPMGEFSHLSPGTRHLSADSRSFSRTTSAPASSAFFSSINGPRVPLGRTPSGLGTRIVSGSTEGEASENEMTPSSSLLASPPLVPPGVARPTQRVLSRSKTGAINLGSRGPVTRNTSLEILLGGNLLTSLPTALFEISNITVLSLRSNKLKELPAAIGTLRNLTELNISNNEITELPSTILDLNLTLFSVHPNPLRQKIDTKTADPTTYHLTPSERLLGPLISYRYERELISQTGEEESPISIPRLYDVCLNILISPRPPSNLPPLLDRYQWDAPTKGEKHPLLDPLTLHDMIPCVPEAKLRQALQALKSSGHAYASDTSNARRGSTASIGPSSRQFSQNKVNPFPRSHKTPSPDDASKNPYFYPCPSPKHLELQSGTDEDCRPSRWLFIDAAEERIEWRDIHGESGLPIKWRGCSPGCLDFLTQEEDEWELEEEEEDM